MKKLLVEINFRLRNVEEYYLIKKKFIDDEYEVINIESFNHRELETDFLLRYFQENKIKEKYEKIVIISNIEDAIFLWHRLYNFLADDFIFFIDKYNYSLLKGKIYEELANMNSIEKEKVDEIYINVNSENIERIEKKLNYINKIHYMKRIEEIKQEKIKRKEEESKRYIFGEEKIEYCAKNKGIKVIKLEELEKNNDIKELVEKLENNTDIMLLYMIMSYKKVFGNSEQMIRLNSIFKICFDYLNKNNRLKKVYDKIFEIFEKEKIVEGIWKVQLCQLLVIAGCKDSRILSLSMKELKKGRDTEKYKYAVMIQLFFNSYMNKIEIYEDFNQDMKELLKELSEKYSEEILIEEEKTENNRKKIAIVADQLMSVKHSTAKAVLDYAINIKKYIENTDVKIFIEDNFRQSLQEGILINQYNSANSRIVREEHYNYLKENYVDNIEIYYSDVNIEKKDRVREMIGEVRSFNPDIILNMNNAYSLSMECLSKYFNSYYLTLGLINWQDNQIYNFYFEGVKQKILPTYKNNIIMKTKAISFEKKEAIYNREQFRLKENDFVMIGVSLMPETDFTEEYIDEMVKVLKSNERFKLIILGSDRLEVVNRKYLNLIGNKILFVKYEPNLGALYQKCDIYLNPPRNGGGYSIAEAMFYSLPVVSFINSYSGKGWLGAENCVETYDEYCQKIERLMADTEYYKSESKKVKENIMKDSFENNLKEIFSYINNK